jgi:hypothetical protein
VLTRGSFLEAGVAVANSEARTMKAGRMRINKLFYWVLPALSALALMTTTAHADSTLRSVTIGAQSPTPASPGGKGMFPITVTRAGAGSLSVYLSVSGLPSGATASVVPPQPSEFTCSMTEVSSQ